MNALKRLFTKKERKGLRYLETIEGHRLYTFEGEMIHESPVRRHLQYLAVITNYDKLKLDHDSRQIIYENMKKGINDGNIAEISANITLMETLDSVTLINDQIFQVCNCYILLDDEPINDFSLKHTEIKKKLYDNSDVARFFFINFAIQYLKDIVNSSTNTNFVDYLKTPKVKIAESLISKLVSDPSSGKPMKN